MNQEVSLQHWWGILIKFSQIPLPNSNILIAKCTVTVSGLHYYLEEKKIYESQIPNESRCLAKLEENLLKLETN